MQILDSYRAAEDWWARGRSLWGEADSQVAPWVKAPEKGLAGGKIEGLLAQLRALQPQDSEGFARKLTCVGNQWRRMK